MSQNIQIQGPVGPRGLNGSSGAPGPRGEQGPIGLKGEPGNIGDIGPKGNKGEIGFKGDSIKGDKGSVGEKGEQGDIAPFVEKVIPCLNFQFMTYKFGHKTKIDEGCMNSYFNNFTGLKMSEGGYLYSLDSSFIPFMSNPCNNKVKVVSIGWSCGCLNDGGIPSIKTGTNNKIPIGFKLIPFRFNKFHYNGLEQSNDLINNFKLGNMSRITYFGSDNKYEKIYQPFNGIKVDKSDFVNYFNPSTNNTIKPYLINMENNPGGSVNVENMVLGIGEGIGIYIISNNTVGQKVNNNEYDFLLGLSVSVYLEKY